MASQRVVHAAIDGGTQLLSFAGQYAVRNWMRSKEMEYREEVHELEAEKAEEIAQLVQELPEEKRKALQEPQSLEPMEVQSSGGGQVKSGDDVDEAIAKLLADEDCSVCRKILEKARDLPAVDKGVLLTEYGKLKEFASTNPSQEEFDEFIESNEVLSEIWDEVATEIA